jgi:hypothetical protein
MLSLSIFQSPPVLFSQKRKFITTRVLTPKEQIKIFVMYIKHVNPVIKNIYRNMIGLLLLVLIMARHISKTIMTLNWPMPMKNLRIIKMKKLVIFQCFFFAISFGSYSQYSNAQSMRSESFINPFFASGLDDDRITGYVSALRTSPGRTDECKFFLVEK